MMTINLNIMIFFPIDSLLTNTYIYANKLYTDMLALKKFF